MKKVLIILIIFLITGCGNKKETKEEKKISSKGELVCVYKENRLNDNATYSSYYSFNFDNNGILKGATNVEMVSFDGSLDSVKKRYEKELLENVEEYKNIKGIKVSKKLEKDRYYFTVEMDNTKMSDEVKKEYYLDQDRITLYKMFTIDKYTCE